MKIELVKIDEVIRMYAISRSSIYRGIEAGTFPDSIRIGPKAVAWILEELEAWKESRPRSSSCPEKRGGIRHAEPKSSAREDTEV